MKDLQKQPPEEVQRLLAADVDAKVAQRRSQGTSDYTVRAGSCQALLIGGHPARSCVAEFTDSGKRMAEHLVYVRSENTLAMFFSRMPADSLDGFRKRFDEIAGSLRIR